jgi:hypothetical protein
MWLERALQLAGLGQVGLALASTTFPVMLEWPAELAKLRPMLRRIFWIYAAYIFTFNLSFGVLSLARPQWLTDGTSLAAVVSGFIATYWGARLFCQLVFDRADMPHGLKYRFAEAALVSLFLYLTSVYVLAFLGNVRG